MSDISIKVESILNEAKNLADLIFLAGEGMLSIDRKVGNAIAAGAAEVVDKIEQAQSLLHDEASRPTRMTGGDRT